MDLENREIIRLIKGCKKQNRKAIKELYQMFYGYAMSICIRYTGSWEEAVEIMNDGFLNVFTYINKFNIERPFKPWLKKVMINCAIDHLKRNRRMEGLEQLEPDLNVSVDNSQLDSVSYEDLIEMIRKLPPAYATVFNMRAIEGYKHEEVAQILGIKVGTSKSNYAKAKQKLQEYLVLYFGVNQ